jgi:hypothetical protein
LKGNAFVLSTAWSFDTTSVVQPANMTTIDMPGRTTSDERLQHLVDANSRAVLGDTHVEPTADMAAERRRATIDSGALAVFMNGGAAKLQRKCVCLLFPSLSSREIR